MKRTFLMAVVVVAALIVGSAVSLVSAGESAGATTRMQAFALSCAGRSSQVTYTDSVSGPVTAEWCAPSAFVMSGVSVAFQLMFSTPVALPDSSDFYSLSGVVPTGSYISAVSCNQRTYTSGVTVFAAFGCGANGMYLEAPIFR